VQASIQEQDVGIVGKDLLRAIDVQRLVVLARFHPRRRRAIPLPDHLVAARRGFFDAVFPHVIEQHSRQLPVRRARAQIVAEPIVDADAQPFGTGRPGGVDRLGRASRAHGDVGVQQRTASEDVVVVALTLRLFREPCQPSQVRVELLLRIATSGVAKDSAGGASEHSQPPHFIGRVADLLDGALSRRSELETTAARIAHQHDEDVDVDPQLAHRRRRPLRHTLRRIVEGSRLVREDRLQPRLDAGHVRRRLRGHADSGEQGKHGRREGTAHRRSLAPGKHFFCVFAPRVVVFLRVKKSSKSTRQPSPGRVSAGCRDRR
jgi:hypothetical protein